MITTASLILAAAAAVVVASASTVPAGDTCAPIPPSDAACGFLAPVQSVLTPGQATQIATSYLPLLGAVCPDVKAQAANFPVILCLGGIGPCNNATFVLPATNADGFPKSLNDIGTFYNNAKFAEVLPSLAALNVQPPCYELCSGVAKSVLGCKTLAFLNASADPCAGLPLQASGKCAAAIGPSSGSGTPSSVVASAAPSTAAASSSTPASSTKPSSGSSASYSYSSSIFAVAVASILGLFL